MSQFLSKLLLDDEDGFPMTLAQTLVYESDLLGRITVPVGFITDLASIPRILWTVLPKVGRWDKPAVIHDFLYQEGAVGGSPVSRATADAVLREGMQVMGVSGYTQRKIYWGVRLGGWLPWRHYRG